MDSSVSFENYLNLAYRYLTIRSRSEKEVRDYLARKNIPEDILTRVISSLKEKKFLNDESFTRSWVLNRARLKPKGKALLKIELRQKGIADEIIASVLDTIEEEVPGELEQAKSLIAKRIERMQGSKRAEIYQKVGGFLSRRGFSWDVVKKAIDESISGSTE